MSQLLITISYNFTNIRYPFVGYEYEKGKKIIYSMCFMRKFCFFNHAIDPSININI